MRRRSWIRTSLTSAWLRMRCQAFFGSSRWPDAAVLDGNSHSDLPRLGSDSRIATAAVGRGSKCERPAFVVGSRHVNVWNGDNYGWEPAGALGIRDAGSAVRAGLVHYNDGSDVARMLEAVAELG